MLNIHQVDTSSLIKLLYRYLYIIIKIYFKINFVVNCYVLCHQTKNKIIGLSVVIVMYNLYALGTYGMS